MSKHLPESIVMGSIPFLCARIVWISSSQASNMKIFNLFIPQVVSTDILICATQTILMTTLQLNILITFTIRTLRMMDNILTRRKINTRHLCDSFHVFNFLSKFRLFDLKFHHILFILSDLFHQPFLLIIILQQF